MKLLYRGLAVGVVQCAIVMSLAGKYAVDRERLPRAWVRVLPVDPNLPIRGRYVSLRLQLDQSQGPVQLSAHDGHLIATPSPKGWWSSEPVAFFIPEHVPDPSRRPAGEELWAEVSVPRAGAPRPIRLGVKKDGVLTPLGLR